MKQQTKETLSYIIHGLSLAALFASGAVVDVPDTWLAVEVVAWALFGVGMLLVILSISTLARNRGRGLIDWGVYAIVRHPMYVGAIVLFLSWILFVPHWITTLISSGNVAIVYWHILEGERANVRRFGPAYRRYMGAVPRMNLLAGLLRRLQSARASADD
jgi:protein-S-isoprenylcysteine O-methyltransferase Ste14